MLHWTDDEALDALLTYFQPFALPVPVAPEAYKRSKIKQNKNSLFHMFNISRSENIYSFSLFLFLKCSMCTKFFSCAR